MTDAREGLRLDDLGTTTKEEIDANLAAVWSWRGPLYEMVANSLMLDYAPEFAKLHRWGSDFFGRPRLENIVMLSAQNIHSYMVLAWETGLRNEFVTLRRNGMAVEQVMELVMFSQLYAGMRGLGHVFRAVGEMLPAIGPPPGAPAAYPEGWAADPEAFHCGLDLSTREMTPADLAALERWYEETIGYLPDSIRFGLKYHPEFVKVNRAKWEVALKTVPKQLAPVIMLRQAMLTGSHEALREAALLARAWGVAREDVVRCLMASAMYFTGFEGLYAADAALDDLLEAWPDPSSSESPL